MSSLVINREPLARQVEFKNDKMYVILDDGREIGVPLDWFPRLKNAEASQRNNYRLIGGGIGIHFPEIDEDISINGLLK